jgi:hypothetical protein
MDLVEGGLNDPINHWYYKHKFWFIKRFINGTPREEIRLVDIGAGSALFSRELIRLKVINQAVAVDTGYAGNYYSDSEKIRYCNSAAYADFNYFLLTDVLEHIDQDLEFLSRIVSESPIGARFIITVPALMSLWSSHDIFLKHFKRYSKFELIRLAEKSSLEVASVRYTYSTVFPFAYAQRKFLRRTSESSHMKENNRFVSSILRISLFPDRWIPFLPFGVSLFMIGEKRG